MIERTCRFSISVTDSAGQRREWSVSLATPAVIAVAGFLILRGMLPACVRAMGALATLPKTAPAAAAGRAAPSYAPLGGLADVGGLAPGTAYGQSAEVITPLNVRDASALVMPPSR
ncbi:MAG: hypothetical protein NTX64_17325 [Elusimicrobia bacterium]|nr:hypothetical protein [Elusimicrobiota bacterium]